MRRGLERYTVGGKVTSTGDRKKGINRRGLAGREYRCADLGFKRGGLLLLVGFVRVSDAELLVRSFQSFVFFILILNPRFQPPLSLSLHQNQRVYMADLSSYVGRLPDSLLHTYSRLAVFDLFLVMGVSAHWNQAGPFILNFFVRSILYSTLLTSS